MKKLIIGFTLLVLILVTYSGYSAVENLSSAKRVSNDVLVNSLSNDKPADKLSGGFVILEDETALPYELRVNAGSIVSFLNNADNAVTLFVNGDNTQLQHGEQTSVVFSSAGTYEYNVDNGFVGYVFVD